MTITMPAPCIEFSIQWPVLRFSLGTLDFSFPHLKKAMESYATISVSLVSNTPTKLAFPILTQHQGVLCFPPS